MVELVITTMQGMVPTLCLPQFPSGAMLDTTYRDPNQVLV